jgi:xanthine dehydrogenase accessory factor
MISLHPSAVLRTWFKFGILTTHPRIRHRFIRQWEGIETREVLETISKLVNEGKTFAVATIISHTGSVPRRIAKMIIQSDGTTLGTIGGGCVETEVAARALKLLKEGEKGVHVNSYSLIEEELDGVGMNCGGKIDVAIEIIEPTPKLVIIGSGHLAQALSRIAKMLDFDIAVLDPMGKKESFPEGTQVVAEFVDKALPKIRVDQSTYIVILTEHKDDVPALRSSLKTSAAYIGMIASRRRAALVFNEVLKKGVTEKDLERVYSPVGLDIGADTPEEIAVSILGEMIKIRRLGREHETSSKRLRFSAIKTVGK